MASKAVSLGVSLGTTPPLFHPHLTFRLSPESHKSEDCATQLSLRLPDEVFVDPDELADQYSIAGISWTLEPPVVDIERPVSLSSRAGIRLNLSVLAQREEVDVPLHVRYLAPSPSGSREISVLSDVQAAYACDGNAPSRLFAVEVPPVMITLPVGNPEHQIPVELTTAAAIWVGWLYLAWKMWRLVQRVRQHPTSSSKLKMS